MPHKIVPDEKLIHDMMGVVFDKENKPEVLALSQKLGKTCHGERTAVVVASLVEMLLRAIITLTPREARSALFLAIAEIINAHLYIDEEKEE